ncbi:MAG: DUF1080 domain-containing protein [Opitutaceae bacterium]|jgi:hypothetical protein|nr:DUF1080 domain-containing protein [Opitutaceae bacterium]
MSFSKSSFPLLVATLALPILSHAQEQWRPLFNGTDFTGWESYLAEPLAKSDVPGFERNAKGNYTKHIGLNSDPLQVFTIVLADGQPAIRISGEGYGVLGTTESFSNYHLRLEFKWGEKNHAAAGRPRNGGLMYHAHGEYGEWSKRWKSALQFQVCEATCGDFIVMGGATGTINVKPDGNPKSPQYDPTSAGQPALIDVTAPNKGRCTRSENFEKPLGEWNTFEVFAAGDKAVHVVNGHVVARMEKTARKLKDGSTEPLTGGQIQLQLELAEEFFRNIEIRAITAIPAEYAEGK